MHIPVVLGTAREGAFSSKVTDFILKKIEEYGFETELVCAGDYIKPQTARVSKEGNSKAELWRDVVERAQGLIIVTPEYNHSFPGELKLLLDSLFDEYEGLVVGLVGVSSGGLGGARAVEHIKPILTNFKMVVTQSTVLFSNVKELFDESGSIKDESYNERVTKLLDEIKWWTEQLRDGK